MFVRDVLAIREFRTHLAIRVDPLRLDACFVGDMFEHLWTLVFIADLSHEEADLVERVRYLVAQLVDVERLPDLEGAMMSVNCLRNVS